MEAAGEHDATRRDALVHMMRDVAGGFGFVGCIPRLCLPPLGALLYALFLLLFMAAKRATGEHTWH